MAKGSMDDELALVKAAAWAWYQHGTACDGRAVREFDAGRTSGKSTCRPSRYKLEATGRRNTSIGTAAAVGDEEEEEDRSEAAVGLSPAHTDMSLLDSYEIESISQQLKRILASAAAGSVGKQGGYLVVEAQAEEGFGRRRQQRRRPPATSKKERDGFWARHAIRFCTSRGDVVAAAGTTVTALGGRRRRKSGSSVRLTADFQFHQP